MRLPRVLIADDHRILAEGVRGLLETEFEVVGMVDDGRELVVAAKQLQPDVIVADITMPSLNGIEAAVQLRDSGVSSKIVFLTQHREVAYARRAIEVGAAGFVLKHSAATELVTAIHAVLRGKTYITPMIAGELLDSYHKNDSGEDDPMHRLTPRQREVLQLIVEGKSAKQIAALLHISRRTAEAHKVNILNALELQNTVELVQYAIRNGIIPV